MENKTSRNAGITYDAIVSENLNRLKAIARSYCKANEQEDLLQEILFQLWRSFASFKGQAQRNTWVYRVALNTAISYSRRESRRPVMASNELIQDEQPASGDLQDAAEVLERFMSELNKVDKAIFLLYLDDIAQQDIADIVGLSLSLIGVRINRMKQKFIKQM